MIAASCFAFLDFLYLVFHKKHKKDKEALVKLEAAKTYEDELAEAIYRQLREDSIAAAKKKEAERK